MRDFLFAKDSPRNVRFYSSKRREGLMTTVCREYSGRTLVAIQVPSVQSNAGELLDPARQHCFVPLCHVSGETI